MYALPAKFYPKGMLCLFLYIISLAWNPAFSQADNPVFEYEISIPEPASHRYHVELHTSGWEGDSLDLKMPRWMPGYYQIMNYGQSVQNFTAVDEQGNSIPAERLNDHTWRLKGVEKGALVIEYDIQTERKFVATSYVDESHAYIVPGNSFLYVEGALDTPVFVKIAENVPWKEVVTGLEKTNEAGDELRARNFDILYDSPILIGDLEELPSFEVEGVEHHFVGYDIGQFDKAGFMEQLEKVVTAAVNIIGDIPFEHYTFIGIGPGRGGIEHLNNTVVSFDGDNLHTQEAMNSMMNFLGHEYFHHYNVKRIRPFELGPFNYDKENRTYLLWVSEGLTVYYEYLISKAAGIVDTETFFSFLEENINAVENDPGRFHQSLAESSYYTWEDGPFGSNEGNVDKAITYYQKGPVVGLLLDLEIRNSTGNKKSLDDVMRLLYYKYYKEEQRGFTDAEFQQACESIAGKSLGELFEYVYTTEELDYNHYLGFAGLSLERLPGPTKKFRIKKLQNPTELQSAIFNSWAREIK